MRSAVGWTEIASPVALWAAWRSFERGKRRRESVAAFSVDADRHVHRLARELMDGSWRPAGYRMLRIADPKRRLISRAPVADRVVHHALHAALAPELDRSLIEHTYACLPGRGTHRAIQLFQRRMQRYRFVLQLDIHRYFYSVSHGVLRDLLHRRLPEPRTRALVDHIIDSGRGLYARPAVAAWLGWDAPGPPDRGLPIGNLTSQWWGNLYLGALDHQAQRSLRVPAWQRYMDDLSLFGDDPRQLMDLRDAISAWLAVHRGLRLKDEKAEPRSTRAPSIYLGYRVSREGLCPGPRARGRITAHVRAAATPAQLQATITATAAMWMFGWG